MSSNTKENGEHGEPVITQPQPSAPLAVDGYVPPGAYTGQPPVTGGPQPQISYVQPAAYYQQPQPQAIHMQTMAVPAGQAVPGQWLIVQGSIPGCPAGLERLTLVDKLFVKQKVTLLEAFTVWDQKNSYDIVSETGQQLYFASEESGLCMRQCCGPKRGFVMHILDNNGQEVISVKREFKCCAVQSCECFACLGCCANEVQIEAPPGNVVGYIQQTCSVWIPRFVVQDEHRETVLKIDGPCCMCQTICCRCDIEFHLNSRDGDHEVGKISKKFGGVLTEMFTTADTFGVSFPMDLDVKMKAVMIGAVFLIDYMYFEVERRDT